MLVWHRRAGKTVANVQQLVKSAVECRKVAPRFAYIAPYHKQAKTIAWDYLRRFTAAIPGRTINESELRVDLPGDRRIQLFGADNPDALRGMYLDGVVLDEYGQMNPTVRREVLIPCLADRDGWEVICGTPKGRNQFYKLYAGDEDSVGAMNDPRWCVSLHKASDTKILPQHVLDEALSVMGPETYAQEFECAWLAADRGSYYAKILERRRAAGAIGRLIHDPGLEVHTAWDLGISDSTAIWFIQKLGPEIRWIDYYEAEGEGLEHYVRQLQIRAVGNRRFNYGTHFVPHDADHRSLQTGKTLVQMAASMGIKMTVVPVGDLNAGIEATRQILERSFFDAEFCKEGLNGLEDYRRKYNVRLDEYSDSPEHNWASHPADAARTFAMAELGGKLSPRMFDNKKPRFARMD